MITLAPEEKALNDLSPDTGPRLITIEGSEGVGKSTLIEGMKKVLPARYMREPGGTGAGEIIRSCLKGEPVSGSCEIMPSTEAFLSFHEDLMSTPARELSQALRSGQKVETGTLDLTAEDELVLFNAARNELMLREVHETLSRGEDVILDRYKDSTVAYQGYGRGLDLNIVKNMCDMVGRDPDLTLLLTIDDGSRRARMKSRGGEDRIEKSGEDFFRRVDEGFRQIARDEDRVIVLNASGTPDEVLQAALDAVITVSRSIICSESVG